MTLFAVTLVTISAFTHALWNYLGKRSNPSPALFLMASLASALLFSPVFFRCWSALQEIPARVWFLLLLTSGIQALYYIFLASAYRHGDLSHVYPLARSLPVILVALTSILLGRGGQIGRLAYLGFLLVTVGCLLLPMPGFSALHPRHYRHKWVLFALLAAFCITAYTLLDDQSLHILRSLQGAGLSNLEWSFLYLELETIGISLFLLVFLLFWSRERVAFLHAPGTEWRTAFLMGFIITATYGLVLFAMGYVSNVSYVIAFRQLSIPLGALFGIFGNKEKSQPPKLVGIVVVFLGLLLVGLE